MLAKKPINLSANTRLYEFLTEKYSRMYHFFKSITKLYPESVIPLYMLIIISLLEISWIFAI